MPRRFLARIFLPAAWGGTGPPIFAGDGGGGGGGAGLEGVAAVCSGEFAGIVSGCSVFFLVLAEDDRLRLDFPLNNLTTVLRVLEKSPFTKFAARETALFV